jgi:UDP-glucose 6-dehydrogenase
LPTARLLAQKYPVVGVDSNEKIIKTLNNGNLPFKEKGLDTAFQKVRGNFKPSTTVEPSDSFIIAVRPSISVRLKYDWIFLLRTYSGEIRKTGKAAVHCKGMYTQILPRNANMKVLILKTIGKLGVYVYTPSS